MFWLPVVPEYQIQLQALN